ncbi:MAG: hypothetical protein JW763_06030 [candidate division Zixibacteria bacterium]|nr:hypothetical protein [candidate division Zixibacteria bacterium]
MKRRALIIFASLLTAHVGLLILFAAFRVLGRDEGFYLNVTRLIGQGMSPYTDFFFTQLSLMPTVFAPLALDGWNSFWILRGCAVAAGVFSAVVLFMIVLKTTKNTNSALLALGMYVFSGLILSWHSVYKPLAFSHLFALATFYFWLMTYRKQRLLYVIMTGLALSALVNLRAVFIVLVPLYVISLWLTVDRSRRGRMMGAMVLSVIPFAIPTAVKIITAADRFFFNTFIFQLHRADEHSWGYIFTNKALTVLKTVIDPHLLIIAVLTVLSVLIMRKNGRLHGIRDLVTTPEGMALMNLVLIAGIYFMPNPILRQYVEQFIAFGIIVAAFGFSSMRERLRAEATPFQRRAVLGIIAGLYFLSLIPYGGVYLIGMRPDDKMYTLREVRRITSQMASLGEQSDTVLAEYAGYPFLTRQVPLPYTELVGFEYPLPLDHDGYMKYKLADYVYLRDQISKKIPRLVVTINRVPPAYADVLNEGYMFAYESGGVTIHTRR